MKTILLVLAMVLVVGCGTISDTAALPRPTTTDDLRWIDTLRQLDEKSDALLGAARLQTARKELIDFADAALHGHSKRSDEIKKWRASSFGTAAQNVALPPCAQREFRVSSNASEVEILDALIAHRSCALSYTNEALTNIKSANARHVLEETSRTFATELQQFRTWRATWK